MTDRYADAQCAAITASGKRCGGGWKCALPVTFAWDPIKGVGIDGPMVVLCHRHLHWTDSIRKGKRFPVAHGWLGAGNIHGYGSAVWAKAEGWEVAPWYWQRRSHMKFGDRHREDAV